MHRIITTALFCGTVSASPALAAHPLLDVARGHYERFEHAQTIEACERALKASDLVGADRAAVLLLRARTLVGKGCTNQAQAAFADLLAADPGFAPEADESPKVATCLARARRALPPEEARPPKASVLPEVVREVPAVAKVEPRGILGLPWWAVGIASAAVVLGGSYWVWSSIQPGFHDLGRERVAP